MYVALALVFLVFSLTTDGVVLRNQNISNLIVQNGYVLILAVGMVMVIVGGHIDLSVGSIVGFVGAISAVLTVEMGMAWWLAVLISLAVGALAGAFQGFWIAYVGIPSFIVTLAGLLTFRGLTLFTIGSTNIGSFPEGYKALGSGFLGSPEPGQGTDVLTLVLTAAAIASIIAVRLWARRRKQAQGEDVMPNVYFYGGLVVLSAVMAAFGYALATYRGTPWILVILTVIVVGYSILTQHTPFGRHIYAVGGNRRAAKLSGIRARRVDFLLFVNMGFLSALAGIVFTARLNLASSAAGTLFELQAIAAAFVGGAAVQGGVGTIGGAIVGGLTIGVINNGMSIMGLGTQWQQTVLGLVLLLVVAFDVWNKQRTATQTV
jgi:putative multiple sugar transport system permease protein